MATYAKLHAAFGKPEAAAAVPRALLASMKNDVSEDVIALWEEDGWARYGEGLLWTVDPRLFADLHEAWPGVSAGAMVFARNAFGDLFFYQQEQVFWLELQTATTLALGPDIYLYLNLSLPLASARETFLCEPKFREVRRALGGQSADECYGLKLALSLGGSDDVSNYHRVGLREYIDLVAQLHQ